MNAPELKIGASCEEGLPYPRGATWDGKGVNFALVLRARDARSSCACSTPPARPRTERIELPEYRDEIWHGYVPDMRPGHRLRLPRARPVRARRGPPLQSEQAAARSLCARPHRRAEVGPGGLRLQGRRPAGRPLVRRARQRALHAEVRGGRPGLRLEAREASGAPVPWDRTIVYETHVRGFTKLHPTVPENQRGTFCRPRARRTSSTTSSRSA